MSEPENIHSEFDSKMTAFKATLDKLGNVEVAREVQSRLIDTSGKLIAKSHEAEKLGNIDLARQAIDGAEKALDHVERDKPEIEKKRLELTAQAEAQEADMKKYIAENFEDKEEQEYSLAQIEDAKSYQNEKYLAALDKMQD